ncbi:MAG: hypothetical protein AB7K67_01045 [Hyphomicrobiaceae bacterium]
MSTAQTDIVQLAERFGMTTADRIAGTHGADGRLPAGESEAPTKSWTEYHQQAFAALSPAAVYVAGNDGPEPRFFGDNMGAWPILLGVTRTWRDTITPQMDRFSPHRSRGVLFRVWTPGSGAERRLIAGIEGLIKDRVDQLHGAWLDFGPNTDLPIFEAECHELARRLGITPTWDDADLFRRIDRDAAEIEAAAKTIVAGWTKGGRRE